MYKLVAVGGKIRGKEYELQDGDNTLGRGDDCDIAISIPGVSKKHLQISVNGDTAFLQDLGSSNGTFLNGKLTKKATISDGDKITLPNIIFQLVYVAEKKVIVKKQVAKQDDSETDDDLDSYVSNEPMPTSPIGKIIHIFKHKLMPVFYGFNESYEWRHLFGILLFAFIVMTIYLTVGPVLRSSKQVLIYETSLRGQHYADEIARLNARALEQKNLDQINSNFLDREDGVASYELMDLEGRIVRPSDREHDYTKDPFSIKAKRHFETKKGKAAVYKRLLGSGEIGIAQLIKAYNPRLGQEEPVGIIAIRFAPKSLVVEASNNTKAHLESLTTSAIVAILFFGIIYYLTIRPLDEMNRQIDQVLRGRRKELQSKTLMSELNPLVNNVNALLARVKEASGEVGDGMQDMEEDGAYVATLYEFLQGSAGPAMVLNSDKLIQHINSEGEDVTGIRESAGVDMDLLDISRDQGFAATVIELCDQSANNQGTSQSASYEISGSDYNIFVNGLVGKDGFAKAFYVSFVKDS